ncbi:MAG: YczE/YyaS/YitT family protein [Actinomycetota bacterium]
MAWPRWARVLQLMVGLVVYGVSQAMLVRSGLGLDPWDVFHQGLAERTGLTIGTWVIVVGVVVLLLWIPLRQRPGIGTVCNALLLGLFLDAALALIPPAHGLALRWLLLVGGIVLCGVATGLYIGAAMGPGPRDGLMVGLANRGHSVRVVRTAIELTVLAVGFLLGGTVGIGTALFAVAIGPIAHVTIPAFSRGPVLEDRRGTPMPTEGGELACASD